MNLLFCSYKFNLNVILADGVLKHFEIYKQNWFKTEAGGQLFMEIGRASCRERV